MNASTPTPGLQSILNDAGFSVLGLSPVSSLVSGRAQPGDGAAIELCDPHVGRPVLSYPGAGAAVVDAAMAAASLAQQEWIAMTGSARTRIMLEIAGLIEAHADVLATIEAVTVGKPIRDARAEVARVAEMFIYYAGWADKLLGDVIPVPTTHLNYTLRTPFGVVAQITPWNAPLFTAGWQVAPALCTGNAVVLKPSEHTPLSSLMLGHLIALTDAPRGLVNVIAGGPDAGAAMAAHPKAALVVFVGSKRGGVAVAQQAAKRAAPLILELGGKSANIVFPDADLDRALLGAQAAIFSGAGQSCVAGSRLLVHRSIHHEFVDRLAEAAQGLRVGAPLDPATMIGPINNRVQLGKIGHMVTEAIAAGARLRAGGGPPRSRPGDGFYFAPTILDDVEPDMQIAREEVFGPVVSVLPFDEEDQAVALANDTPYGLAGAVWTNDVGRAHRIAARVHAGTFWINSYKSIHVMSPFGGFGDSGYGRSSGKDATLAYTQSKSVWVETAVSPPVGFGLLPNSAAPR